MRVIAKSQQTCNISISNKPNRSAIASIATVWSAIDNWTFATKTYTATTAITTTNIELCFVNKGTHLSPF
jgi:hypothetical protein